MIASEKLVCSEWLGVLFYRVFQIDFVPCRLMRTKETILNINNVIVDTPKDKIAVALSALSKPLIFSKLIVKTTKQMADIIKLF